MAAGEAWARKKKSNGATRGKRKETSRTVGKRKGAYEERPDGDRSRQRGMTQKTSPVKKSTTRRIKAKPYNGKP